jgi:hypothetical protein
MPISKRTGQPPESDEPQRFSPENDDAIKMGRWVVGIIAVLVAVMLAYDTVAPTSHPSTTTGAAPASHKVNPARNP